MEKSFYSIYKTFFKIGLLLLGGGYVILPLLQSEIVDKKHWINSDELCDFYALSQSISGVIAVNTALFVGYKLNKNKGAVAALMGVVTPAFLIILIIAKMFQQITSINFLQEMFVGINIAVIMLLYLSVKEMWAKSVVDLFTVCMFFGALILSVFFNISPALIVVFSIICGILYKIRDDKMKRKKFVGEDRKC